MTTIPHSVDSVIATVGSHTVPDTNSSLAQYFISLENKLKTCDIITNSNNVIIGESHDLMVLDDSAFPRLEVLVTKDKGDGYFSQRQMEFQIRYSIAGYIRRAEDSVTIWDMVSIMNFGIDVRVKNYQLLDDKQAGNEPCEGFLKMGGYSEGFYEFEVFPKTSAFILEMEAHIQLNDTEV